MMLIGNKDGLVRQIQVKDDKINTFCKNNGNLNFGI